jgi:hypothetical protein
VLYDILAVCFRKDYTISHLFSAAFLKESHPELESNYWELLREPSTPGTTTFSATFVKGSSSHSPGTVPDDDTDTSFNMEELSLRYPPSQPAQEDDPSRDTFFGREGRFRANHHHVHCPDFVPHGPDVA